MYRESHVFQSFYVGIFIGVAHIFESDGAFDNWSFRIGVLNFWFDFQEGDPDIVLMHQELAFAGLMGYSAPDQRPLDLIIDPTP